MQSAESPSGKTERSHRRFEARACRWTKLCALLLGSLVAKSAVAAQIRVRAETRITRTVVAADGDWLELRGALQEDTGTPVQGAALNIDLPDAPPTAWVAACQDSAVPVGAQRAPTLKSGSRGDFCLRFSNVLLDKSVRVRYGGDDLRLASEARMSLSPRRGRLNLSFGTATLDLKLDAQQNRVRVTSAVEGPADLSRVVPLSLSWLEAGQPRPVGEPQAVQIGQSVSFVIPSRELGQPGPAELRVSYDGDADLGPSEAIVGVRKLAMVTLTPLEPNQWQERSGRWLLRVQATTAFGSVPSGAVEARLGQATLDVRELRAGTADLMLDFASLPRAATQVSLVYLPREPWWLPGKALTLELPPKPEPAPWLIAPWILGFGLITYSVLQAWRRPARSETAEALAPVSGVATARWIDDDHGAAGWRGTVVDAHDGRPIANAEVSIQLPSFFSGSAAAAAERSVTSSTGGFTIEPLDTKRTDGALLVVSAATHRSLSQRLPRPGTLTIHLVSRRRALISELVTWSKSLGAPWARSSTDPTPGQIARTAIQSEKPRVAEWAHDVERAAFSTEETTETLERSVTEKKPTPYAPPD